MCGLSMRGAELWLAEPSASAGLEYELELQCICSAALQYELSGIEHCIHRNDLKIASRLCKHYG